MKQGSKEGAIIKLIKKLKEIKPFTGLPKGESNGIWRKIELKKAEDFYKKGFYSEAEYKRAVEKIKNTKLCSGSLNENQK